MPPARSPSCCAGSCRTAPESGGRMPVMHPSLRHLLAAAVMGVLAAGCASSSGASRTGSQHNLITSVELERAGDVSLYDALAQLRPAFLRPRTVAGPQNTPTQLQVYVGQLQMEGVQHLREIMAKNVKEV